MLLRMEVTEDTNILSEYSGGPQFSTFPLILVKLATSPSPAQTKWMEMSPFWPQRCWEEWGDKGTNPKLIKKLSLGA